MHFVVQRWPISATEEGLTPPIEPGSAPSPWFIFQTQNYFPNQNINLSCAAFPCPLLTSLLNTLLFHKQNLLNEARSALSRKHLLSAARQLGLMMDQGWQILRPLRDI